MSLRFVLAGPDRRLNNDRCPTRSIAASASERVHPFCFVRRRGNAAVIAQGKKIFFEGVPSHQIAGCAACHGANGQGQGPFPRLAGQHAPYLLKQLLVIQSALRTAPVMHGIIKNLNRDEMQAVATFLNLFESKSLKTCDVGEFLPKFLPASRLQAVQKNMPTRMAMTQPHCSRTMRSRSTSAAKASVTTG